jgi:hypothetical protein
VVGAFGGRAGVRWLIAVSATTPLCAPAFAGAWGQAKRDALTIVTISRAEVDRGETWRTETLSETGLGGGWGVNFKFDSEQRFAGPKDTNSSWRLGAQKSFAVGERGSVALIVNYVGGDSYDGSYCHGDGGEVRAAAGTSFEVLGREAFVNVEAGFRSRGEEQAEDCNRALGEVAVGMEVMDGWTATVKTWAEDGGEGRSSKVEASLSRSFGSLDVGLGWREEVSGAFEEKGWLVSVMSRF